MASAPVKRQALLSKYFAPRVEPKDDSTSVVLDKGTDSLQAPVGISAVSSDKADAGLASGPSVIPAKRSRSEIPDTEDEGEPSEEMDAGLASDLDGDFIGDDEIIQGPDDDDDENPVELKTESVVISGPVPKASEAFERVLRATIVHLVEWAKANNIGELDPAERPMTFGFWAILKRVSVDFLVALYLQAIPSNVQTLFEKETWSMEDFLSLSLSANDERQGIYCNLATGDIKHMGEIPCDAYVGSSFNMKKRTGTHQLIARKYSPSELPQEYKRSFHYGQICRKGVRTNFRMLAAFDTPISTGYLNMLETIFMILFRTFHYPGFTTRYANKTSYQIVDVIRASEKLPVVSWRGMNAAWPLSQGVMYSSARVSSPCYNPVCRTMTYSTAVAAKMKIARRRLADPGNPLGPYLCGRCGEYRDRHQGSLPDEKYVKRLTEIQQTRQAAGKDAACYTCGRLESQFRKHFTTSGAGNESISSASFRVHELVPNELLCHACCHFVDEHKRVRTQKEIEKFLSTTNLADTREAGGEIACENCGVIEGSPTCDKYVHIFNDESGMVLCMPCRSFMYKHKKHRDPRLQRVAEARFKLNQDREAGIPVMCKHCPRQETWPERGQKFLLGQDSISPVCAPCYNKHRR